MNVKQKMIEAMQSATEGYMLDSQMNLALDAALAVLVDPENWTPEMDAASDYGVFLEDNFRAVINHVRGLPG